MIDAKNQLANPYPVIVNNFRSFIKSSDSAKSYKKYFSDLAPVSKKLRQTYKESGYVDYSDHRIRDVYMFRYFPVYIESIYHILNDLDYHPNFEGSPKVGFMGCGPCPEALGFSSFIWENFPGLKSIELSFFDKTAEWNPYRDFMLSVMMPKYTGSITIDQEFASCDLSEIICSGCSKISRCKDVISTLDYLIFQNCLNEITDEDSFMDKFSLIFDSLKEGALVVVVDLNYSNNLGRIRRLESKIRKLSPASKIIVPVEDECSSVSIEHKIPDLLWEDFFHPSPEEDRIPRSNSRFYYSVIRK